MKLFRVSTLLSVALAVASGAALFWTSQNVQRAEHDLRKLENAKAYEGETIRVLRAEWDYLNRPERLEELASEYLDLVPPDVRNVARTGRLLPDAIAPVIPGRKPERFSASSFSQNSTLAVQPALYTPGSSGPNSPMAVIQTPPRPSSKPSFPSQQRFRNLLDRIGKEGGQ